MITTLRIQGMHCASCKALIEDACRDIPGVTSCFVDLGNGSATVEHHASMDPQELLREIGGLGEYSVTIDSSV